MTVDPTPTPGVHPPGAPSRRARLRDPFRWMIENPGTVDLIAFGGGALLLLVFTVGTGAIGWWTPWSVPMVAAGAVCRVRPLAGVVVSRARAAPRVRPRPPVVPGPARPF